MAPIETYEIMLMTIYSPGRRFAALQMKLILAYVVVNYDIQPIAKRPVNWVFGDGLVPSLSAKMTVRRRKRT